MSLITSRHSLFASQFGHFKVTKMKLTGFEGKYREIGCMDLMD